LISVLGLVSLSFILTRARGDTTNGQNDGANANPMRRTVAATGTHTRRVDPDAALISFGVTTKGATIDQTRRENAAAVKKLRDGLEALKIPGLQIKTTAGNMHLVWHPMTFPVEPAPVGAAERPARFEIKHVFAVGVASDKPAELREFAQQVVDNVLENGANSSPSEDPFSPSDAIPEVTFIRRNARSVYREVMSDAIKDAFDKAKGVTKTNGEKLSVVDISEVIEEEQPNWLRSGHAGGGREVALKVQIYKDPFEPDVAGDKIVIKATVRVTYAY